MPTAFELFAYFFAIFPWVVCGSLIERDKFGAALLVMLFLAVPGMLVKHSVDYVAGAQASDLRCRGE